MVTWSESAKSDLRQIHDFIAKDSRQYAKQVGREIARRARTLVQFPRMGRVSPKSENENVREIFIYSYRLIYEIVGNDINILALIHFQTR